MLEIRPNKRVKYTKGDYKILFRIFMKTEMKYIMKYISKRSKEFFLKPQAGRELVRITLLR